MEARILNSLGKTAGLAGLCIGLVLLLFKDVLQTNFLTQLEPSQGFAIIFTLMILTFGVAGIGLVAWLISRTTGPEAPISRSAFVLLGVLILLALGGTIYFGKLALGKRLYDGPIAEGQILTEVPLAGILRPEMTVFVDDKECPEGEIKRIIAGDAQRGVLRRTYCVARRCSVDGFYLRSTECEKESN
jgi:hypothetical protein